MPCRCDNITIAPKLLSELEESTEPLNRKLWPEMGGCDESKIDFTASHYETFRKYHEEVPLSCLICQECHEKLLKSHLSVH